MNRWDSHSSGWNDPRSQQQLEEQDLLLGPGSHLSLILSSETTDRPLEEESSTSLTNRLERSSSHFFRYPTDRPWTWNLWRPPFGSGGTGARRASAPEAPCSSLSLPGSSSALLTPWSLLARLGHRRERTGSAPVPPSGATLPEVGVETSAGPPTYDQVIAQDSFVISS